MLHNLNYSKQSFHTKHTICDCGRQVHLSVIMMNNGTRTCPHCRKKDSKKSN